MRKPAFASLLALITGLSFWTLAPYGGCSCNNPLGPSAGPTPTATPTHGPVVDKFDDGSNDAATRINNWNGGSEKSVDTFGRSAYNSELTADGTGAGGVGRALHFYGVFGKDTGVGACGTYPFVAHRMYLAPGGAGGDDNVTISVPGGAVGIRFDAKTTTPSNKLIVKLILKSLSDYSVANPCNGDAYAYHNANVTLSSTWTTMSMPLSGFTMPSWCSTGKCAPPPAGYGSNLGNPALYVGGGLRIMAIQFEPTNASAYPGNATFDYYIDNLEFY